MFFVDANALLELYSAVDPQVDEIPTKLLEAGDSLFVPRQVVDEVERGKRRVAETSIKSVQGKLNTPSHKLPSGLRGHEEELQTATKALRKAIARVGESASSLIQEIAESRDGLSMALAPVFAKAIPPTPDELARARDRRERGNPPGKPKDPLGDQLAWEQLLTHAVDADILWLVTGDSDFATGSPTQLNPLLYRELRAVAPNVKLRIHGKNPKDLACALNEFFDEEGRADARFSDEQMDYFDHITDQQREPWECFRDSEYTPICYATCTHCGAENEHLGGEERYVIHRVRDGYEVALLGGDDDHTIASNERCPECSATTFEIEFEKLCSYCQHVFDGM